MRWCTDGVIKRVRENNSAIQLSTSESPFKAKRHTWKRSREREATQGEKQEDSEVRTRIECIGRKKEKSRRRGVKREKLQKQRESIRDYCTDKRWVERVVGRFGARVPD